MAITIKGWQGYGNPGECSCRITYEAGDALYKNETGIPSGSTSWAGTPGLSEGTTTGSVLRALYDFLVSKGWNKVTITSNEFAAGKLAMEAPNLLDAVGASSKKYMVLDLAAFEGELLLVGYELIPANGTAGALNPIYYTTLSNYGVRVGTNTVDGSSPAQYLVDAGQSGYLCVCASAQHVVIHSYKAGGFGGLLDGSPCGLFELGRILPEDSVGAGFPHLAAFNLYLGWTQSVAPVYVPRTRFGPASNGYVAIATNFGASYFASYGMPSAFFNQPYPMAATQKLPISNIIAHEIGGSALSAGPIGPFINLFAFARTHGPALGGEVIIPRKAYGSVGSPLLKGGSYYTGQKFIAPDGTPEAMWAIGPVYHSSTSYSRFAVPK